MSMKLRFFYFEGGEYVTLIVSQDKEVIINPAQVTGIYISNTTIYADCFKLGYYQTKDEALKVLRSLQDFLSNPNPKVYHVI